MSLVAQKGASALLGAFLTTNRFDRVLEGMVITEVAKGRVVCEMEVTAEVSNSYGTLHGGCTSTIIDIVGTSAALTVDPLRPGVSVDMSTSLTSSAKVGERLYIEGKCLKSGKRLAFTEVKLWVGGLEKKLIATGTHTKAL